MNTINSAVLSYIGAKASLAILEMGAVGAPFYTSVEDYYSAESSMARDRFDEQESRRQELLDTMAANADILANMERKIGTAALMKRVPEGTLGTVLEMLNY